MRPFVYSLLALPFVSAIPALFETLVAQGLIGSHFGPPSINASYDYIVLGGGTAGLTIATRLSQNNSFSVAVVEAGSFYELTNGNFSEVPALAAHFVGADPALTNPLVDWVQYTEPEAGFGGRKVLFTTGKTLGGSSARNYMLFMRSAIGAYQKWADQVGDQSYTYDKLLPYFEKSIDFVPPNDSARAANSTPKYPAEMLTHTTGPLQISYPNFATSFASWVILALNELGLTTVSGFLDGNILGVSYSAFALNRATQTRQSSENTFLRLAMAEQSNLVVYQQTLAKKILFDANKKASGVLVTSGGAMYQLNATKEIIVSSGTLRSPQLLMVSGIGPAATLQEYDIPVLADRPGVGQNMMDHVSFGIAYAVDLLTHSALANPTYAVEQYNLYLSDRTGALTSTGGELISFERLEGNSTATLSNATRTGLAALPTDWPTLELFYSDAFAGNNLDFIATVPPSLTAMYGTSEFGLTAPFSRGNVSISSADTAINPIVHGNYLSDPRDQEVAIAGFKRARQVWATQAMSKVRVGEEAWPGAQFSTDAEIWTAIQAGALPIYHAAATCAMGNSTDPMAVVDSHARVMGVTGLRVVDASAFPFLPPGHPQGSIYALAEKIADLINTGQ